MKRRTFVRLIAATPLASTIRANETKDIPKYKIVTPYKTAAAPGMPGPYPGKVISVKSAKCLSDDGLKFNDEVVREMMERGMRELTGDAKAVDSWRRFIAPDDVVGVKVNVVGRPWVVSSRPIVAEVVRNLTAVGVKPAQIYVYDRFRDQLDEADYAPVLPEGVNYYAAERANQNIDRQNYDPGVYVEADMFGEEDTRSNMMKLISQKLTKIINIPNMKDHGATGVTGCLKNIAYGGFSNVARTHHKGVSHTLSFVGELANVEPIRSRAVLQIMDGLRGVWHAGPGAATLKYVFFPRTIMFGTDPVAIDRLLLDVIDEERKRRGAISIWNRDENTLDFNNGKNRNQDPNTNIIIREPGHVEYAGKLGLGVHDIKKILVKEIEV
ncbi:MAG TPA: DUF362 domain-containing protein [Blastocatellia bacterium]|nr:DUF362 domain-containing protein [Blastocatellia bacterium]